MYDPLIDGTDFERVQVSSLCFLRRELSTNKGVVGPQAPTWYCQSESGATTAVNCYV